MGELGFLVGGGALAGYGAGYGLDLLLKTRWIRVVGIFVGLGTGFWAAGRELGRFIKSKTG